MLKTFAFLVEDSAYYFNALAVEKVVDFIERFCRLSDPMGATFTLLPWQRQIVTDVFGWKRRDNDERRFTHVYIEVPRKNGKTYFVAALVLYLLIADGTQAAEVYGAAVTRDQSGRLYKSVSQMVNQSRFLAERLSPLPYKSEYHYAKGKGSVFKALSGESVGSHGRYPSAVVCDELHEWQGHRAEDLYEALTSGFGNRKSPLVLHITTAGYGSQPTLCKRLHEKAKLFAEGNCEDETYYGVVYGAELDEVWTDEEVWKRANPSYELVRKTLRREFAAASSEPSRENTFRRLYLNQWTQQQTRWLDLTKWDACCQDLKLDNFKGRDVLLGVDFSQIYDLTAIALLFPQEDSDHWIMFVRCYMPQKQIERRSKEDNVPYDQWANDKWLVPTLGVSQGLTIDYPTLVSEVETIAADCNVLAIGYDPSSQAVNVIPQLEDKGLDCLPIYQSHNELSPPSREFEKRLTSGEITLQRNPCLRWQAGNVEVEWRGDKIKPVKPNARGSYGGTARYKVDGIVAAIIAAQTCLLKYKEAKKVGGPEGTVGVYFV